MRTPPTTFSATAKPFSQAISAPRMRPSWRKCPFYPPFTVVDGHAHQGAVRPAGPQHPEEEDHSGVSLLPPPRQSWRGAVHFGQVSSLRFYHRRLVAYLLSDLSDQNAKDYSLLQNQRSSQNIGVVVGNMLSGCYKKGVELIDQFEEPFQSTFLTERFRISLLPSRTRLLLLPPSRVPSLRRTGRSSPLLLCDSPRPRGRRGEREAGAAAVRDGGVGRGESSAGPAQPGAQRALAAAAVRRVLLAVPQRQGGRRTRVRRPAAAAGPPLSRQIPVDERSPRGAHEDAGGHRAEEVHSAGVAAAEREGRREGRVRRRFSSSSARVTRRWRRVSRCVRCDAVTISSTR